MKPFGFPRQKRLLRTTEFASLHKFGRRSFTEHFIIYLLPNELQFSRLGVSINANTGNAVERNRLKRVLREFFRLNQDAIQVPSDIHIAVKRGVKATNVSEPEVIRVELKKVFLDTKNYTPIKASERAKANQRTKGRH